MTQTPLPSLRNGEALPLARIPVLHIEEFRSALLASVSQGARVASFFGCATGTSAVRLMAVLAHDRTGRLSLLAADVDQAYASLTPACPQLHWFERELYEQWGVYPQQHPWLKPVRFQPPLAPTAAQPGLPGVADFYRMQGPEAHEVAVGPVHAGIIEPGHFRFQCHGEEVFHLEIELGYQHRGVERAWPQAAPARAALYAETLAGDTSIAHATAWALVAEALGHAQVPPRVQGIRAIALELERLANHTGDLGALANDVGYLPTAAYCGRIRGDFLNMSAVLCGSRFGRGLVRPGAVLHDLEPARAEDLLARLKQAERDASTAINLLWDTNSVRARFENTGVVSRETAVQVGLVGIAARACGLERDVRQDYPHGVYRYFQIPVATCASGDVFARAYVRWLEMQRAIAFIREQVHTLPEGPLQMPLAALKPDALAVSLVESWRGEVCHVGLTDETGRISRYKIVDPSFHNWFGLALALRDGQISDFPLCNKSFNLSYCGHDL